MGIHQCIAITIVNVLENQNKVVINNLLLCIIKIS